MGGSGVTHVTPKMTYREDFAAGVIVVKIQLHNCFKTVIKPRMDVVNLLHDMSFTVLVLLFEKKKTSINQK